MSSVGIIANPASGKDIRRLVAHASVFDNNEKINILQRILLALDAIGVERTILMPDYYDLGERALDGIKLPAMTAEILGMNVTATDQDSTHAAERMCERDVACIIVLGGDGTNRVVAKGCGSIPIIPVSTGTNNVFPIMVEGTIAGMAAGLLALGLVDPDRVSYRAKRLEVYLDGKLAEIALIDVVTSTDLWVGTRAIWDVNHIQEIVLARAEPGTIGLSSIGSCFQRLGARDPLGMYLQLGSGGRQVLAPMAPGIVSRVPIRQHRVLNLDEQVTLADACTIALDGERHIEVYGRPEITVRLTANGPRVIDLYECMEEGVRHGAFLDSGAPTSA